MDSKKLGEVRPSGQFNSIDPTVSLLTDPEPGVVKFVMDTPTAFASRVFGNWSTASQSSPMPMTSPSPVPYDKGPVHESMRSAGGDISLASRRTGMADSTASNYIRSDQTMSAGSYSTMNAVPLSDNILAGNNDEALSTSSSGTKDTRTKPTPVDDNTSVNGRSSLQSPKPKSIAQRDAMDLSHISSDEISKGQSAVNTTNENNESEATRIHIPKGFRLRWERGSSFDHMNALKGPNTFDSAKNEWKYTLPSNDNMKNNKDNVSGTFTSAPTHMRHMTDAMGDVSTVPADISSGKTSAVELDTKGRSDRTQSQFNKTENELPTFHGTYGNYNIQG